jgi:hypothetical protein
LLLHAPQCAQTRQHSTKQGVLALKDLKIAVN